MRANLGTEVGAVVGTDVADCRTGFLVEAGLPMWMHAGPFPLTDSPSD